MAQCRTRCLYVFAVGVQKGDEQNAINAGRRFNYIRFVPFPCLFVEKGKVFAAILAMLVKIKIRAVGNAFEFPNRTDNDIRCQWSLSSNARNLL